MTKTEYESIVKQLDLNDANDRLYSCSAWTGIEMIKGVGIVRFLRSYRTIIAIAIGDDCYTDGYYSATSSQHVRKFMKKFHIDKLHKLYIDSKMRKAEKIKALESDFASC